MTGVLPALPLSGHHGAGDDPAYPYRLSQTACAQSVGRHRRRNAKILEQIEGLTSGRLKAERTGLSALDAREFAYGVWGASYINAAFAYTRREGNRFNDGKTWCVV